MGVAGAVWGEAQHRLFSRVKRERKGRGGGEERERERAGFWFLPGPMRTDDKLGRASDS